MHTRAHTRRPDRHPWAAPGRTLISANRALRSVMPCPCCCVSGGAKAAPSGPSDCCSRCAAVCWLLLWMVCSASCDSLAWICVLQKARAGRYLSGTPVCPAGGAGDLRSSCKPGLDLCFASSARRQTAEQHPNLPSRWRWRPALKLQAWLGSVFCK